MLTDDQLMRYSRQILLSQFDVAGQEALANARVLIVGAGGLGCPAALYLAGAGVGELTLVDGDQVDTSNLHRQIAYTEKDPGRAKAAALADHLRALNSEIIIHAEQVHADEAWLKETLSPSGNMPGRYDLVLDCTDNFAVRSAINRACLFARTPLISAAAIRMEGQLAVFDFREPERPCYGCLYGEGDTPDTLCSESGVLGPVVGVVGSMQALLAIRLLAGEKLPPKLYLFDGASMEWRSLGFGKDPGCPVCAAASLSL